MNLQTLSMISRIDPYLELHSFKLQCTNKRRRRVGKIVCASCRKVRRGLQSFSRLLDSQKCTPCLIHSLLNEPLQWADTLCAHAKNVYMQITEKGRIEKYKLIESLLNTACSKVEDLSASYLTVVFIV